MSKIKDGAYIKNLDEYGSIRTRIALYVNENNLTYFDSFGVKTIGNEIIIKNTYRIEAYDSIMCGYFCIGFIDFMLKCKSLLEYINLFSPYDYEKNDEIIL